MLILTASEVERIFDLDLAFASVRDAALAYVADDTTPSPRSVFHGDGAEVLVMPAGANGPVSVKLWYALDEPRGSLPRSSAVIVLVDPELGHEVVMDGGIVTDLRTGAMSGLAAAELVAGTPSVLSVIGTGIQARTQIQAMLHALPTLDQVVVFSREPGRRVAFAAAIADEIQEAGRAVRTRAAESAEEAASAADVLVLATTSRTPVIQDSWLTRAVLVAGVGSHDPGSSEIPIETVLRAQTVAVDTRRGAIDGAGDIASAIETGRVRRDDVRELGQLFGADVRGTGLAVFKSVGFARADLVSARAIARRAIDLGVGTQLALH